MNELLLVTENWKGQCEHNFVSTFDELAQNYMEAEDRQTVNNVFTCIERTAGNVDAWSTYYISHNVSLDVRACVDQADLKSFLSGRFNDSVESLESRLPGATFKEGWYWDNDVERFSPRAMDVINRECPELLVSLGLRRHGGKSSLADIIKKASFIQENITSNRAVPRSVEHMEIK